MASQVVKFAGLSERDRKKVSPLLKPVKEIGSQVLIGPDSSSRQFQPLA